MALEFKLTQKLSQSLVMTPQLQQAIKLLHLGRLEYLEMITDELESNPVLESLDERGDDKQTEPSTFESTSERYSNSSSGGSTNNVLENTLEQHEGLSEHLLWQLRMSDLSNEEQDIASYLIGNLDPNGYLGVALPDVAQMFSAELSLVEAVLIEVQSFDPIGIAARDLRECLLLQLEHLGHTHTLAWRIVAEHLRLLEYSKYDEIASAEQVAMEDIQSAIEQIRKLEPRPARPFFDEVSVYIVPDVYVRRVGDEYVVSVNDSGIPKLRLNPQYQKLAENVVASNAESEYLREKLKAAAWLIKSVEQRQHTILRVTESIMRHQREFLEKGVATLRPLILKEIAEDVGLHQSTVSRITTNKYVHTPQGVYELKFFFSSRLKTEGGTAVSSESVRNRIQELIGAENPQQPLSDQAIAKVLIEDGIEIARRTVAKYREAMGVLSSSRRKKKF